MFSNLLKTILISKRKKKNMQIMRNNSHIKMLHNQNWLGLPIKNFLLDFDPSHLNRDIFSSHIILILKK